MSTITTKIVAGTVAGIALAGVSTTAQAAPSNKDRAAITQANKVCQVITDEYSFEACIVGEFVQTRGRLLDPERYDYDVDNRKVRLTGASHKVPTVKVTKATKADRKALKIAQSQANYATTMENDAQWMDVLVGDFILNRGRFISADWVTFNDAGEAKLTRHSVRVYR